MNGTSLLKALSDFTISSAVAAVALVIALVLVATTGVSPFVAAEAFADGVAGDQFAIAGTVSKVVPLLLVALAWIVVARTSRYHVGFPGQIIVGGATGAAVALQVSLPLPLHLPLVLAASMAGGAAYAAIAAWLWAKRRVNEILSTLLLNLIAVEFIAWLVRGPLQEPSATLPQTAPFPETARWPAVLGNSQLHWDIVLIPVGVITVAYLLYRTDFGFRLRLVGSSEQVARHAGMSPERVGVQAMLLSGALAGLAGGSLLFAAITPGMTDSFGAQVGYQGIAVALLARNSPAGAVAAALLFAALDQGGGVVEATVGVSSAVLTVTQGLVILLVLVSTGALQAWRTNLLTKRREISEEVVR